MLKDFNKFMSQLKETNQTLDFFCDFEKISQKVEDIKLSLCMLNSLIGAADLRGSVETIWKRDPKAFSVMDILVAVRTRDKKKIIDSVGNCVPLESMFTSVDSVLIFLEKTGLGDILQHQKVKDLVDYVFGIETGLDTNARKNRSGRVMENTVSNILTEAGVPFRQEVYSREWKQITEVLGDDEKRFDFVVETASKVYLIEVNFYSDGGSKLNEVARSYSDIAPKINSVEGFEFVWITDGMGWKSAKNKLQEAYGIIPNVYNLTTIYDFIKTLNA
ncbi:dpmII restriction endonuclease [Prevotella sp. CAG:487]|jgi:type II restriction enzyme|nr:dpmII restriction endonuclease [Prevotella sp. CAG:487]